MKGKVAPTKSTKIAYVSFCLLLSAVALPVLYRFLYREWKKKTKLFHSICEMFFTFLARKTLWVKLFSLNVCEALLQGAIKGGNFGAKLTHLCGFWLDVSFLSHVKKHRSRLWLARTNFRTKICDIAFWWVFLSVYIIKVGTWRCLDNKISGWQQTRNVS